MKTIYNVCVICPVEGEKSPNYLTLNKEKAEQVLKLFLEFRSKYPKFRSRMSENEYSDFIQTCNSINKELSQLVGKEVDLSYISKRDTIELLTIKLDDDLEA